MVVECLLIALLTILSCTMKYQFGKSQILEKSIGLAMFHQNISALFKFYPTDDINLLLQLIITSLTYESFN